MVRGVGVASVTELRIADFGLRSSESNRGADLILVPGEIFHFPLSLRGRRKRGSGVGPDRWARQDREGLRNCFGAPGGRRPTFFDALLARRPTGRTLFDERGDSFVRLRGIACGDVTLVRALEIVGNWAGPKLREKSFCIGGGERRSLQK